MLQAYNTPKKKICSHFDIHNLLAFGSFISLQFPGVGTQRRTVSAGANRRWVMDAEAYSLYEVLELGMASGNDGTGRPQSNPSDAAC